MTTKAQTVGEYKKAVLKNLAEKAIAAAESVEEQATRALARLDKEVKDNKKDSETLYQKAEALNTKAADAVEARDAKALTDAKKAFVALQVEVAVILFDGLDKRVRQFLKDAADKRYSDDLQAELKDGATDLLALMAGTRVYIDQMKAIQTRLEGLAIADVDIKKAAKVLEIDHQDAKIAKVLSLPVGALEKGLDGLAKELKLKTTGREMLANLRKAKVI